MVPAGESAGTSPCRALPPPQSGRAAAEREGSSALDIAVPPGRLRRECRSWIRSTVMADLHTRYLGLVEKAKATVQIPVIASVNGVTPTIN